MYVDRRTLRSGSKEVTFVSFFITYNGKANSVAWELDIVIEAFLGEKVD